VQATTEAELKILMVAGLTGEAAAHRALLDRLSGHLRAYFKSRARISAKLQNFFFDTRGGCGSARPP